MGGSGTARTEAFGNLASLVQEPATGIGIYVQFSTIKSREILDRGAAWVAHAVK
jgi:hypothetical protein